MKKTISTIISLILLIGPVFSQNERFLTSGSIVFEKTVNLYGLLKQHIGRNPDNITLIGVDKYKENHSQFKKFTSTLLFDKDRTLFVPDPAAPEKVLDYNDPLAAPGNTYFTNFADDSFVAQKNVYDELLLINGNIKKISWRYTGETRVIAGYTCRRANAIVMDSVYAVAFYTDKIHVSGGPESFTGLPGMILGLALPGENVTWFATKITDTAIDASTISPPRKGKSLNSLDFGNYLSDKMKTWGSVGQHEKKVFLF